jgi:hypothetical protein
MHTLTRRAAGVSAALLLVLGLIPLAAPPVAQAFYPDDVHIPAFKSQLGAKFDAKGQEWVILGLRQPDVIGQGIPEWHFDSAKDPTQICDRWRAGPRQLLDDTARFAVEAFRRDIKDPPGEDRVSHWRQAALVNFGEYLHAIQDFYAHSNWIELAVVQGKPLGLAPILDGCDVSKLPPDLVSGYFDPTTPPDFCGPPNAPRPPAGSGFRYCHGPADPQTLKPAQTVANWLSGLQNAAPTSGAGTAPTSSLDPKLMLAKDLQNLFHGADQAPGTSQTYHQLAVDLATQATAATWPVFHDRVVAAFKQQASLFPNRDPECLFTALVKGTDPACPKATSFNGNSADPLALAYWLRPIAMTKAQVGTWTVRSFQADVGLDPVTGKPVSGAITVDLFSQPFFDLGGGTYYRTTLDARKLARSTMSGDVGTLQFADPVTYYQTPPLPPELARPVPGISYTFSDVGQLVFCQGFTASADPATQRRECLASTIAVLNPP